MDTTPMTVGVDSPSHALIKKKNNLQNNLTLQRKQNLVFHHVKKASEVIMNLRNWTTEVQWRQNLLWTIMSIWRNFPQTLPSFKQFFGKRTEQTEHSN